MNMTRDSGCYKITNTASGHIYIGSAIDLRDRRRKHFEELRRGAHHSVALQRAWAKYGEGAFRFEVILICEPFELLRYEQALIDLWGPDYNICPTAGNCLGRKLSPETIERLRAAQKGKKASDETKAKMSAVRLGHLTSDETRQRIGLAQKGKRRGSMSDESRARMSAAQTGHPTSTETRAKISAALTGKTPSDETRAKLSAAKMGQGHSDVTRAQMSVSQKKRRQRERQQQRGAR